MNTNITTNNRTVHCIAQTEGHCIDQIAPGQGTKVTSTQPFGKTGFVCWSCNEAFDVIDGQVVFEDDDPKPVKEQEDEFNSKNEFQADASRLWDADEENDDYGYAEQKNFD